ncbi:P-loop containing nucleoside triphosphate hydrolase protein [Xylaria cf. heliscus]|nr:P-loop containing nucleoside triphosphate hydrolase protein [Xylaria cf. heliscus]
MSRGPGSSSHNHHTYGPPSSGDHDRYIQQIIDHTSSLFPETPYQLARGLASTDDDWSRESIPPGPSQAIDGLNIYEELDDYDRIALGHPQPAYQPSNLGGFPSNSSTSQRVSLPLNAGANRPSRVLGDASHHFRPFIPRDPHRPSPFQSIPRHHGDEYLELERPSPIRGIQHSPDSPPIFPHQLSARNSTLTRLEPLQLPPFAPSLSNQKATEHQRGTPLFTTPLHHSKKTPPVNSSRTGSSPSNLGHSSPSARVKFERQRQIVKRNQLAPKWNEKLQLDLEHASNIPPIVNNTRLVDPRQSLPDKFRAIFPFPLFNAVQSQCFPLVYDTNDNVVISAPTGSGKTAILEMAICKLVASQGNDNFKIVYQAPTKSLCSEKTRDWQTKFSHMNLQCVELTGDTSQAEAHRVSSASIIVTTPEKWDSITRKWKDHRKLLELVRLVLIDEVHILKDTRGATLEAVVSRMKTIGGSIRFVAISATVPNINDVAKWLGRDHQNQLEPARFEVFGEELRPVKLQRYVYGYEGAPNDFIFEQTLDGKLNLLLAKHSEGKPIMVFCFTRKSCQRTARSLAEWWSTCRANDRPWPPPDNRVPVLSQDLQELVRYGVAFHHAGLDAKDRAIIEMNFLSGQLHVICCTSTLAVGVNLPCHTVVLKGTNHYTDNGSQEYTDLDVMQMLGRAGRPQFDNSATAIIMTRLTNVQRYKKLVSGEELLESTLHRNLLEHLNSEIGLGTIQDMHTAKKWISGTFLSVRVRQSPSLYNLENVHNAAGADERMEEWCERDVKLLQDHGLVTKHTPLVCTEYGQAMSRYMIQFETMKLLLSIPPAAGIEEMLTIICKAGEFKDFRFKPAERAVFRELNRSPLVLHPVRETLTLTWHKIFMIVQICLGGVDLPTDKDTDFIRQDLLREKRMVFDRMKRLVRCVVDCKAFEGDGLGTKAALDLNRSIAAQAWENKPAQLFQIPGFGPVAVRKWISHGVHTVLDLADKGVLDIERIASRNPPYGRNVQKILENFPRLTLKADIVESKAPSFGSDGPVSVTVKARLGHHNPKAVPCWKDRIPVLTFMALNSDGSLAYFWRGNMKKLEKSNGLDIKFPVALTAPNQTICCYFDCEEIVGTRVTKTLEPNIPASAFRNVKRQATQSAISKPSSADIEEDYEDIPDEAMLEALDLQVVSNRVPNLKSPGSLDNMGEDFPLIDELLMLEDTASSVGTAKMDNGRYVCNHQCHNGGLTKLGKPCNHKCCREGISKYRPPKPLKKSSDQDSTRESEKSSRLRSETSQHEKPRLDIGRAGNWGGNHVPTDEEARNHPLQQITKVKRRHSTNGANTPKRAKLTSLGSPSSFLSDVEYVDLRDVSDGSTTEPVRQAGHRTMTQRNRQRLLVLHEEVKGHGILSPRLTKGYKAKPSSTNRNMDGIVSNIEQSAVATHSAKTVCKPVNDDPFSDRDDDMSDLPDLDEIFDFREHPERPKLSDTTPPRVTWTSDETLYPGVVHTLKESIDYGLKPNLSFTTIDELHKASDRFDLPPTDNIVKASQSTSLSRDSQEPNFIASSSPLPGFDATAQSPPGVEEIISASRFTIGENHSAEASFSAPIRKAEEESGSHLLSDTNEAAEVAWVADSDSDLINSLRGIVNIID